MVEKSIGLALMAMVVWGAFHFFGNVGDGPRAVIAQAPVAGPIEIVEWDYSVLP